jgi:hypothetical protein
VLDFSIKYVRIGKAVSSLPIRAAHGEPGGIGLQKKEIVMSSKRKSSRRPTSRRFIETLWIHYADYATGRRAYGFNEDGYREAVDEIEREEHWGRRETCAKCRKEGTFGNFTNFLTARGFVVYTLAVFLGGAGIGLLIEIVGWLIKVVG